MPSMQRGEMEWTRSTSPDRWIGPVADWSSEALDDTCLGNRIARSGSLASSAFRVLGKPVRSRSILSRGVPAVPDPPPPGLPLISKSP